MTSFNRNIVLWLAFILLNYTYSIPLLPARMSNATYFNQRDALLLQDATFMLGHDLNLSPSEELVNVKLMSNKSFEYSSSFLNLDFPPAIHFFKSKPEIENSAVFQFLKQMPKGAVLHTHDQSMTSIRWVISNITYWDDLYMCTIDNNQLLFKFFDQPSTSCAWQLVTDVRATYDTPQEFDDYLYDNLCLYTAHPEVLYPDINSVWEAFERSFIALDGLINYRVAWEAYLYQAMTEFKEDNVIYFEFRGVLTKLYEKNGTILSDEVTVGIYKQVVDSFVAQNPTFYDVKYIYAPPRLVSEAEVYQYVDLAIRLKDLYPDFVLGFDLVGQEDLGKPLKDFINPLLLLGEHDPPIPVFYHAGETDWQGTPTDENLFDALLLNTSRIGHGYAIIKHPALMDLAVQSDIPIEVCPLSNQILMLVDDMRNHPAAALAANSFPLVISSDDPSLWDALPLSHDFYEAFMGIGGAHADLKFLKKLVLNSIKYTGLDEEHKSELSALWLQQWSNFIASQAQEIDFNYNDSCNSLKYKISVETAVVN